MVLTIVIKTCYQHRYELFVCLYCENSASLSFSLTTTTDLSAHTNTRLLNIMLSLIRKDIATFSKSGLHFMPLLINISILYDTRKSMTSRIPNMKKKYPKNEICVRTFQSNHQESKQILLLGEYKC